jgi:hypothetical protein
VSPSMVLLAPSDLQLVVWSTGSPNLSYPGAGTKRIRPLYFRKFTTRRRDWKKSEQIVNLNINICNKFSSASAGTQVLNIVHHIANWKSALGTSLRSFRKHNKYINDCSALQNIFMVGAIHRSQSERFPST